MKYKTSTKYFLTFNNVVKAHKIKRGFSAKIIFCERVSDICIHIQHLVLSVENYYYLYDV